MPQTLQPTFPEALKLMRERAGFTQVQLAKYLELSRNTLARYEDGVTVPKWKDVQSWAQICDHDPQLLRELWVETRESGCLYGSASDQLALFDAPPARNQRGQFGAAAELDEAA